jgi:ER membrane protein complex subunit 1
MRSNALFLWLVAACSHVVLGVFTDEAYSTDYHHPLLGAPLQYTTFFHRPQSDSRASLLYTFSEKGVVGAINPKDGSLVWRQELNNTRGGFLRAGEGETIVMSGADGKVQAWDALVGKLAWENDFSGESVTDLEVMELEDAASDKKAKDVIVSFSSDSAIVRRLSGATGDEIWEFKDTR